MYLHNERGAKSICDRLYSCRRQYSSVDLFAMLNTGKKLVKYLGGFSELRYEGRTESHEQLLFACELGAADEGECGGRWNQLLCYP